MPASENFLIRRLSRTARKHLLDQCALFDLVLSDELSVRGQPLGHAHLHLATDGAGGGKGPDGAPHAGREG